MHHPDLTVYVEIREKYAYVHAPSVPGAGGLPIGMGGRAVSLPLRRHWTAPFPPT